MSSQFCCCQKFPNHFWKLRNNARLIIHIFMYFSHLYLIQKNPELFSVSFKWKRDQQQVFFSFSISCWKPSPPSLHSAAHLEPFQRSGTRRLPWPSDLDPSAHLLR